VIAILTNPIYVGYVVHRDEWIKADVEPLASREQWDLVQEIRRTRFPHHRDPVRKCLLGILHDEQGRRMKIQRGTGRATASRHYKSEYTSWSRDGITRRVMVAADRVERLTVSALRALLVNRVQLKEAILSLGLYSDEIARRLKMGRVAARRVEAMDQMQVRSMLLALVPRAEVTPDELRLYVSCFELSNFLAWDGIGVFGKSVVKPSRAADRVYVVHAPAFLVCGHPRFAFPLDRCEATGVVPKPWLVELLHKGAEMRRFAFENRDKSVTELAHEKHVRPCDFARLLRINYLAPDIQAAIIDGTQPEGLTAWDILKGPMPLDWEQQRQLLGFV
jgi:hypothetical protein